MGFIWILWIWYDLVSFIEWDLMESHGISWSINEIDGTVWDLDGI